MKKLIGLFVAVFMLMGMASAVSAGDAPTSTLLAPIVGDHPAGPLTVAGVVEADDGAELARVFVIDVTVPSAKLYLQDDLVTMSTTYNWVDTPVLDPGEDVSAFSVTTGPLPAGDYWVLVRGEDEDGDYQENSNTLNVLTLEPAAMDGADIPIITGIKAEVWTTTPPTKLFVSEETILPNQIDHNTAHTDPYTVTALRNTEEIRFSLIIDPDGPQPSQSFAHQPGGLWNRGTQVFPMTFFSQYTGFVNADDGFIVPGSENGEYGGFGWQGVACGQDGCAISDTVYVDFVP